MIPAWLIAYATGVFRGTPEDFPAVLERCSVAGADFRSAVREQLDRELDRERRLGVVVGEGAMSRGDVAQASFLSGFLLGRNDREDDAERTVAKAEGSLANHLDCLASGLDPKADPFMVAVAVEGLASRLTDAETALLVWKVMDAWVKRQCADSGGAQ